MPYLYQQTEKHDKAIAAARNLLNYPESNEEDVKHEIYSIIALSYYCLNNIAEAVSWLQKILAESNNEELIKHMALAKETWEQLL